MSAHVVVDDGEFAAALPRLQAALRDTFTLEHVTLQIEQPGQSTCAETMDGACLGGGMREEGGGMREEGLGRRV